jgi:hypothetical protein
MYIDRELTKRIIIDCEFDNCNSSWVIWGRWVILGVVIAVFIIAMLLMRTYSSRRVRQGKAPVAGTGWMVPPSYYQSEQQYRSQGPPPAPPYNPTPLTSDAGYYDRNGNFVQYVAPAGAGSNAPPSEPPPSSAPGEQEGYAMKDYYPYDRKSPSGPDSGALQIPDPARTADTYGSSSSSYMPPSGSPPRG